MIYSHSMKTCYQYEIGIYHILIKEENDAISGVHLSEGEILYPEDMRIEETPLIEQAGREIDEYFHRKRSVFTLPLLITGTDFQQRVYRALLTIEYGKTASYKDIAIKAGSPKGARAVGNAVNKNPIGIIVPCHRVIGSNGSLVGFEGGLVMKQYLLDIEKY